jgi:hypothetical protein
MLREGDSMEHRADDRPRDAWTYILGLFGLGNIVNGAWMLADPRSWYERLPAGVPDFGPLNEHFVRDIGSLFVVIGAGLVWGARSRRARLPAVAFASAFTWLHAIVHVYDTARGLVGSAHWLVDLGPIYLPAVVLAFALRSAVREARGAGA